MAIFLVLFISGCASVSDMKVMDFKFQMLESEIERERAEIKDLQRQVDYIEERTQKK